MQIIEWNMANKIIQNAALAGLSTDIWTPPPGNYSKLDFDESYKTFTKSAGFGSIIRTSARAILTAYMDSTTRQLFKVRF